MPVASDNLPSGLQRDLCLHQLLLSKMIFTESSKSLRRCTISLEENPPPAEEAVCVMRISSQM